MLIIFNKKQEQKRKKNEKRTDRGEEEEKTETFITVWKQRYREKNVSFFNIQRSSLKYYPMIMKVTVKHNLRMSLRTVTNLSRFLFLVLRLIVIILTHVL